MTDTSLLDDPTIVESIHRASDELLRRNREHQTMSTIRETLLQEVNVLPSAYCPEVLDFIESLKRQPAIPETMLMSEKALAKDWDTAEEDSAWASL
jgi:hypothetical protein